MSDHFLRRELEERMQRDPSIFAFIESAWLDGMWVWDAHDIELGWFSPGSKALFGYADHEIENSGLWWRENVDPHDRDLSLEAFQRHIDDPDRPYDQIVRFRHRNGSTVWVRSRGLALRDEQGRATRVIGSHTDVTELVESRLESERAARVLQAGNRALEEFSTVVAHDLRAPLRHVKLLSDLIREDPDTTLSEYAGDKVERIQERVMHASKLIDALLTYARAGTAAAAPTPVDLAELIEDVRAVGNSAPGFEISARCEVPRFWLQRTAIAQALQNLVENAISHHDRDAGRVEIVARRSGDQLELTVEDDGPGIRLDQIERLLRPFESGASSRSDGVGIGLAIVRRCVEQCGGDLAFERAGERGTRVRMSIPAPSPATILAGMLEPAGYGEQPPAPSPTASGA